MYKYLIFYTHEKDAVLGPYPVAREIIACDKLTQFVANEVLSCSNVLIIELFYDSKGEVLFEFPTFAKHYVVNQGSIEDSILNLKDAFINSEL